MCNRGIAHGMGTCAFTNAMMYNATGNDGQIYMEEELHFPNTERRCSESPTNALRLPDMKDCQFDLYVCEEGADG